MVEGKLFVMPDFSTTAALSAAKAGQLEPWLYAYLQGGAWANPGLLEGLQKQPRWWLGPLEVTLDRLSRCCGPEPSMEYWVPAEAWDKKVTRLAAGLTDPTALPPLIVEYDNATLSIRDGNHRHEAMRRRGWRTGWVVIWHNSWEEWQESWRRWMWRN